MDMIAVTALRASSFKCIMNPVDSPTHWDTKWRTADIQNFLNQKIAHFVIVNVTNNHQKRVSNNI